MNGTIADSIIIRVGHGIMTIPRNADKSKNGKFSQIQKEAIKED